MARNGLSFQIKDNWLVTFVSPETKQWLAGSSFLLREDRNSNLFDIAPHINSLWTSKFLLNLKKNYILAKTKLKRTVMPMDEF